MMQPHWITPEWPAHPRVRALSTLRSGGTSEGNYTSLNLATHVGDRPEAVAQNRALLRDAVQLPSEPIWLEQVHGTIVWTGTESPQTSPVADAAVTRAGGQICAIMTADCLPVIFSDLDGTVVGAAHAGWRGLVGGVLSETVREMNCAPHRLIAWLGPAIEPSAFEVGEEVREAFLSRSDKHAVAFAQNDRGRWQADLYQLARHELHMLGIDAVFGGGFAVFADSARFFSYRREKQTGRMATMVWLD